MNPVAIWIAKKGLDVTVEKVVEALKENKDSINNSLGQISEKLDILIQAPYKAALMHYREGNLEQCKHSIISAIAHDEWNLPALFLYIHLLRLEGNYNIALDYYWDILNRFGCHNPLIPKLIVNAFNAYLKSQKVELSSEWQISHNDNVYPSSVYCSLYGIVTIWREKANWKQLRFYDKPFLTIHLWRDKTRQKINLDFNNGHVQHLTNRYFVFETNGKSSIFDMQNGTSINNIFSEDQITTLFGSNEVNPVLNREIKDSNFSGITIKMEDYDYEETKENSYYSMGDFPSPSDGWRTETVTVRHIGGQLRIKHIA